MTLAHRYPNGKVRWKCDVCGKEDFWNRSWWTYGDIDGSLGDEAPTLCSDDCRDDFNTKMKLGIIEVPEITHRGYTTTEKGERRGY